MRWQRLRRSSNVDDRRGQRLVSRGGGLKLGGGLGVAVVVIGLLMSQDLGATLSLVSGGASGPSALGASSDAPRQLSAEELATKDFFQELHRRFGAPGDFAQAYVLGHEVGHHVQTLLGISEKVPARKRRRSEVQANQLSVLQELQADCLTGVWGHFAKNRQQVLEQGDLEEALAAAAASGDDALQKSAGRRVQPESWTHGSSDQRMHGFRIGMREGSWAACDTFGAPGAASQP